ncbi:MAG: type II toxin-antitoxin system HicA family toxin [Deltaproteobacteria bacterium]|nr:type II toxin-antitoxin system HicA family toxin [Deltaproteobacteria bacterium]MBW2075473.1 type II toxin-antitoxin system HicA family toxin [Deltaproteobacteria bacterium]RLB81544.1 MAG: type II toxin-antitoxin system HicA family toxin [Deltaproteobacteria bacterium]
MSKKLPVVSGKELVSGLISLGYHIVRQRGSHIRLEKSTKAGVHKITIPNHNPIAKGTLNDILTRVSIWNQVTKDKLIEMIKD